MRESRKGDLQSRGDFSGMSVREDKQKPTPLEISYMYCANEYYSGGACENEGCPTCGGDPSPENPGEFFY